MASEWRKMKLTLRVIRTLAKRQMDELLLISSEPSFGQENRIVGKLERLFIDRIVPSTTIPRGESRTVEVEIRVREAKEVCECEVPNNKPGYFCSTCEREVKVREHEPKKCPYCDGIGYTVRGAICLECKPEPTDIDKTKEAVDILAEGVTMHDKNIDNLKGAISDIVKLWSKASAIGSLDVLFDRIGEALKRRGF